MTRERKRYLALIFLGGILLCLILYLVFSNSIYTLPRSVIGHDDPEWSANGGTAVFILKLNGLTHNMDMFAISEDIAKIAKHEVEENHTEGTVRFNIVGDGDDMYGHTTQLDAFSLQFTMDDLKQIDWNNFNGQKLLNLGKITNESNAGEQVIAAYCEENQEASEMFCAVGAHR